MRRHLISAALAAAFLVSAGSAAQAQYYDRPYNDPYARPYQQPYQQYQQPYQQYQPPAYQQPGYPYEQRAQRGGLRILEAWYGRGRRVCDASHALRGACEGRGGCSVKAGNELCGDPVPGVVKGLTVTYRCHGRTHQIDEMEPRHLGIRCD
jgi:hypothetical protein